MDFVIPDEYKELQSRARSFIETDLHQYDAEIENNDGIEHAVWRRLVKRSQELGLYAPFGPKAHGVGGIESQLAQVLLWETMAKTNFLFSEHMVGKSTSILNGAPDAVKEDFIIPMLRGEKLGPFAGMTEPNAGSDMSAYRTTAVRDGDNWILNGSKCYISGADLFDWGFYVAVIDEKTKKHAHFCLDRDAPGIEMLTPYPKWLGTRGIHHVTIKIRNCVVPDRHRANPYAGQDRRAIAIKRGTTMLGAAQKCQDFVVEFVKKRHAFGRPLAKNQFQQFELAESAIELHAARLVIYNAAWKADQGLDHTAETGMAKIMGTEVAERVARRAIRCIGGPSLINRHPAERLLRDAVCSTVLGGTNEIYRLMVARNSIGNLVEF